MEQNQVIQWIKTLLAYPGKFGTKDKGQSGFTRNK